MSESGHSIRYAATVGMFDGVHRGHQFLLEQLKEAARSRGLEPMVLTFSRHPLETIAPGHAPELLTSPAQREELIRELSGVGCVKILDPSPEFLRATGQEFLEHLHDSLGVDTFVMGFNNHIGSDRASASALAGNTVEVIEASPLTETPGVSSSAVREAIEKGDIAMAENLLGHRWKYRGRVVEGKQLGRTIGFPTANIEGASDNLLLPPVGVYAVDATLESGITLRGMANIGHRPTVDRPEAPLSMEVNIFDYCGDLYGRTVDITFIRRLRDERRFPSVEALRQQLEADREAALLI